MTNTKNLTEYKKNEVERKVRKMHFEDNSCLRVIAEKIVNWRYFELDDEFKALKFIIKTLKKEGVSWTKGQVRRAIKNCYDPRYYCREAIKEVYELAEREINYLPQVPKSWDGITEWVYSKNDESENWHAERERISSDDLNEKKYEYWKSRKY
ncbi:MAG: hypothetical protein ACOC5D_05550 [Thermoplasmatota archaeon]